VTVLHVAMGAEVRLPHGATLEMRLDGSPVQVEVGWLGGRFHQLRTTPEVSAAVGDRVGVRLPRGDWVEGVVLDPAARRQGPSRALLARLARLADEQRGP